MDWQITQIHHLSNVTSLFSTNPPEQGTSLINYDFIHFSVFKGYLHVHSVPGYFW